MSNLCWFNNKIINAFNCQSNQSKQREMHTHTFRTWKFALQPSRGWAEWQHIVQHARPRKIMPRRARKGLLPTKGRYPTKSLTHTDAKARLWLSFYTPKLTQSQHQNHTQEKKKKFIHTIFSISDAKFIHIIFPKSWCRWMSPGHVCQNKTWNTSGQCPQMKKHENKQSLSFLSCLWSFPLNFQQCSLPSSYKMALKKWKTIFLNLPRVIM